MEINMAASLHRDKASAGRGGEFKKPRRKSSFSAPLTFVVVVVAVIFVMSVFFRVSDIEVEGNTHYSDDEIIRAMDIEQGDNLLFFDRFGAVSRAHAKLPYVEQVAIERKLPNKVIITVEESEALAYLVLGDEKWTMDHGARILGKAAEGETASLIAVEGISPGTLMIGELMQTADQDEALVQYVAEVLDQIEARGYARSVSRVDFADPESVEFFYAGKYTVVLGGFANIERKFGMFAAVLDKLKEGDVGIIDVSDGVTAHFSPT